MFCSQFQKFGGDLYPSPPWLRDCIVRQIIFSYILGVKYFNIENFNVQIEKGNKINAIIELFNITKKFTCYTTFDNQNNQKKIINFKQIDTQKVFTCTPAPLETFDFRNQLNKSLLNIKIKKRPSVSFANLRSEFNSIPETSTTLQLYDEIIKYLIVLFKVFNRKNIDCI